MPISNRSRSQSISKNSHDFELRGIGYINLQLSLVFLENVWQFVVYNSNHDGIEKTKGFSLVRENDDDEVFAKV